MRAKKRNYDSVWHDEDQDQYDKQTKDDCTNNIVLKIDDEELIRVYEERKENYKEHKTNDGKLGRLMPLLELWQCPAETKKRIMDDKVIVTPIKTDECTGTNAILYVDYERNYERNVKLTRDINDYLVKA